MDKHYLPEPEPEPQSCEWLYVQRNQTDVSFTELRRRVAGGWLHSIHSPHGVALCFIPDPPLRQKSDKGSEPK